jgi:transcriptional regulator with XRE-family HTH domain
VAGIGTDDEDYRVRLGRLIRQAREARGWSQHELALRMRDDRKLTGTQVSRWERGQQMPSPDNFRAIERALGARLVGDEMIVDEAQQLVAVVRQVYISHVPVPVDPMSNVALATARAASERRKRERRASAI